MWLICKHWMRQQAQIGQQGAHTPQQKKNRRLRIEAPTSGNCPQCVRVTLLTTVSAICIRTLKSSSLTLAVQNNETRLRRICCHATAWWHLHAAFKATPLPFFIEKCITSLRSQENQFTSCSLWVWYVMTQLLSSRKMYIFAEGSNWWLFSSPVAAPVSHLNSCEVASFSFFTATLMLLALFIPFSSIWTIKMPQPACGTNKSTPAKESDF